MSRYIASLLLSLRSLVIAFICTILMFTYAPSAMAIGSTPSRPDQGTAPLNDIYREAEKAVQPENALDGKKVIDRANQGPNEVQKDADVDQMNRPENSGQATSVIDQIQDALSKVTSDSTK
jgi:hypothetical protein